MLSIQDLTKVYRGGKKAVDSISMEIESGEFIAFIGTSGSGKTTALRMINRMIEPTSVEQSRLNGKDLSKMNAVKFKKKCRICHSTNWFNATYDNSRKYCI
jgi:osmoprotectant transport system ATP-binding protein